MLEEAAVEEEVGEAEEAKEAEVVDAAVDESTVLAEAAEVGVACVVLVVVVLLVLSSVLNVVGSEASKSARRSSRAEVVDSDARILVPSVVISDMMERGTATNGTGRSEARGEPKECYADSKRSTSASDRVNEWDCPQPALEKDKGEDGNER